MLQTANRFNPPFSVSLTLCFAGLSIAGLCVLFHQGIRDLSVWADREIRARNGERQSRLSTSDTDGTRTSVNTSSETGNDTDASISADTDALLKNSTVITTHQSTRNVLLRQQCARLLISRFTRNPLAFNLLLSDLHSGDPALILRALDTIEGALQVKPHTDEFAYRAVIEVGEFVIAREQRMRQIDSLVFRGLMTVGRVKAILPEIQWSAFENGAAVTVEMNRLAKAAMEAAVDKDGYCYGYGDNGKDRNDGESTEEQMNLVRVMHMGVDMPTAQRERMNVMNAR